MDVSRLHELKKVRIRYVGSWRSRILWTTISTLTYLRSKNEFTNWVGGFYDRYALAVIVNWANVCEIVVLDDEEERFNG